MCWCSVQQRNALPPAVQAAESSRRYPQVLLRQQQQTLQLWLWQR
jgi:hypothetical protein